MDSTSGKESHSQAGSVNVCLDFCVALAKVFRLCYGVVMKFLHRHKGDDDDDDGGINGGGRVGHPSPGLPISG